MERRSVVVVAAVIGVVALFLVIRDPVGAAGAVREGWDWVSGALATVANSLTAFLRHLLE